MILGIDIGGTSVKLALIHENGQIETKKEVSVNFDGYQTPILETVVIAAKAFLLETGQTIAGIGVSATGQVDPTLGKVIGTNGKIPNYEGAPIKDRLQREFSVPVTVLNDANAAALGECFRGAGAGLSDVLMVTLGTGVGGGIVLGGHIYGGARGIAGEIGHFTLCADGIPCPCGKTGCFESYASTTALLQLARERTGELMDGRTLFDRVAHGDSELESVLRQWIEYIAQGLSGLVHIFNPQALIVGGGVCRQDELLMKPLRKRILELVMPRFGEGLLIGPARLGNDAGVVGAVKFWLDSQ